MYLGVANQSCDTQTGLSAIRNSKYKKTQRFGNWICFRSRLRGGDTYSVGPPFERANLCQVIEVSSF
jgi:hypothetical protein